MALLFHRWKWSWNTIPKHHEGDSSRLGTYNTYYDSSQSRAFHQSSKASVFTERIECRIESHIGKERGAILAGPFQAEQRLILIAQGGMNQSRVVRRHIALTAQVCQCLESFSSVTRFSTERHCDGQPGNTRRMIFAGFLRHLKFRFSVAITGLLQIDQPQKITRQRELLLNLQCVLQLRNCSFMASRHV